jgi:hypothetical protein
MIFPPYQVPYIGNGMVIGCNAVLHVIISHGIAIGAFAMTVLGEIKFGELGHNAGVYPEWQEFRRGFLRFAVFTITIVGAVTGTGIWFTTLALAPHGISSMLRVFFWAWFFEYFTFLGEIVLLIILYFTWDYFLKKNKRILVKLLAGYVFLSLTSAVAITGNLGFMLTPGSWVREHGFWNAFLNPTFLPQLVSRVSFAFTLGSIIMMCAVIFWGRDSFRAGAVRLYGKILLCSLSLLSVTLLIYYSIVPQSFSGQIPFAVLTSHFSRYPVLLSAGNVLMLLIILACSFSALFGSVRVTSVLVIPAFLAIAISVAQFERVREFIRGPYLVPGHMYVSGILLSEMPMLKANGMTATSPWFKSVYAKDETSRGAYLFAQNCMACHTITGINGINERLEGRTLDGIHVIIGHTHELVPFMPPFAGSENERTVLAGYLFRLTAGKIRYESLSRSIIDNSENSQ